MVEIRSTAHEVVDRLCALLPLSARVGAVDPATIDVGSILPEEAALITGAGVERRREFAAGRLCARKVLGELGIALWPLHAALDGSPLWPGNVRGSISHKSRLCVVVAGPVQMWEGVGVDVEAERPLPGEVWSRVLLPSERSALTPGPLGNVEARVIFSAKEAYYKWYKSSGYAGEPGFGDVHVRRDKSRISAVPVEKDRFPAMTGRCVVGTGVIVVVGWTTA